MKLVTPVYVHDFCLTFINVGETFQGCPKCGHQVSRDNIGGPFCPLCSAELKNYIVVTDDFPNSPVENQDSLANQLKEMTETAQTNARMKAYCYEQWQETLAKLKAINQITQDCISPEAKAAKSDKLLEDPKTPQETPKEDKDQSKPSKDLAQALTKWVDSVTWILVNHKHDNPPPHILQTLMEEGENIRRIVGQLGG